MHILQKKKKTNFYQKVENRNDLLLGHAKNIPPELLILLRYFIKHFGDMPNLVASILVNTPVIY